MLSFDDVYVLKEPVSTKVEKSIDPLSIHVFQVAIPLLSTDKTLFSYPESIDGNPPPTVAVTVPV